MLSAGTGAGRHMKQGAIVGYENTVYACATDKLCNAVLERESGMIWKRGFFVSYSRDCINPGDREHTQTRSLEIDSRDTSETLDKVARTHELIVEPGVHRASSVQAAEAAKVIDDTRSDLNAAPMYESAINADKLGMDTSKALAAASSKWSFQRFKRGLSGGHCTDVDAYYLTYKAKIAGCQPQVSPAGRRINAGVDRFIAEQTIKPMLVFGSCVNGAKVNVMGLTIRENCGDLRNTNVIDIKGGLQCRGVSADAIDLTADLDEATHEDGVKLARFDHLLRADAIMAALAHREYQGINVEDIGRKLIKGDAFSEAKAAFDPAAITRAGYRLWRL
jgi:UDP-N-acetyl-D-glucosamine/UDP-N-acetyl-D-galactosamine dehydrogenase